ncbi:MAG: DUF262 domain-containing HNH endonuclease family protein [Alphaproteobacteria bacterium]|jgi:uncharacterized protein with ParB-like and HNH nuclease domain|nr:DUF262 domain-containing HNH endonuclease family protein [Alphaproteobacteria bacterium]
MAELTVDKKIIKKLFSEMGKQHFIIPEYQRPYNWGCDDSDEDANQCCVLWDDIKESYNESPDDSFYLGTIIVYKNKDDNLEVIDGQQRITSLLLLLRAFYTHLEAMKDGQDVQKLKSDLEECLWDPNKVTGKVSKEHVRIESCVITDEHKDALKSVLEQGAADNTAEDAYSKNYLFFREQVSQYAEKEPMGWEKLCAFIINKCLLIPVECANFDDGLRLFSTINDRGMSLSATDIFKARLYKEKTSEKDSSHFIEQWNEMYEIVDRISKRNKKFKLETIFNYYHYLIRAEENDVSSGTLVELKKYYSIERLNKRHDFIMDDLVALSNFWWQLLAEKDFSKVEFTVLNDEAKKYLHCLLTLNIDWINAIISVYYYKNFYKANNSNTDTWVSFLKHLTAFSTYSIINKEPGGSNRYVAFQACKEIVNNGKITNAFRLSQNNHFNDLEKKFRKNLSAKISKRERKKSVLLLHAYLNKEQKKAPLLGIEIEHILPQNAKKYDYTGWSRDSVNNYMERLGNLVIIEKITNIKSRDNILKEKKEDYKNSDIADVLDLSRYSKNNWLKEDIDKRETEFLDRISNFVMEYLR